MGCRFPSHPAIVYVDGFNLYRHSLEGHPSVKWLDLYALCWTLLPDHNVLHVNYLHQQT